MRPTLRLSDGELCSLRRFVKEARSVREHKRGLVIVLKTEESLPRIFLQSSPWTVGASANGLGV